MTAFFKIPFAFLLLSLISCQQASVTSPLVKNDTVEILNRSILLGLEDAQMPSASLVKRKYRFGDSALLTSAALPLNLLPTKLEEHGFKVLPQEAICSMITSDTSSTEFPNYLMVSEFEKNDTGYYVQLKSLSCLPYGGGGSLGLYFKRANDSLVLVHGSSSSIN